MNENKQAEGFLDFILMNIEKFDQKFHYRMIFILKSLENLKNKIIL
jgi:hypothetical protein